MAVLVDAAPPGLGRRADIIVAVSRAAGLPVLVPTGLYRDAWIPEWARAASEEELRDWMVGELMGEIEDTDVAAGWIKLGASDGGLTEHERKALRAAVRAGHNHRRHHRLPRRERRRGPPHARHRGTVGLPGRALRLDPRGPGTGLGPARGARRRGAWVEFDSIGHGQGDQTHIDMIRHMLDAGLGEHVLLSMDSGWYDPGLPDCRAGCIKGYTYLSEAFLPRLREAGVDEATVGTLTRENPFHAFARPK